MIDWDSCVLWLDSKYFSESYWWDRSQYQNNGVIHGVKWKGNAFYFDGEGAYVDCGENESIDIDNEITIEAWIKTDTTDTYGGEIVNFLNSYVLRVASDGNIEAAVYNGTRWNSRATSNVDVLDNMWHHVVWTFNESTDAFKIFVDGEEKYSTSFTPAWSSNIIHHLNIGRHPTNGSFDFEGLIGLARIYNKYLDDNIIKILHNIGYRRW